MTTVTAHLKVTSKLRGCTTIRIVGHHIGCLGCGVHMWLPLRISQSSATTSYIMSSSTAAYIPITVDETDDRFWPLYKMLHYDRDVEAVS